MGVLKRPFSSLAVLGWIAQMTFLLHHVTLEANGGLLAADFARYGAGAQWRGVYYRGDKIGLTVEQTLPKDDGYEIQEDGKLQMVLFGARSAARIKTVARVDRTFLLKTFSFLLDPGSGPVVVEGAIRGHLLDLTVKTPSGTRHETRELKEPPNLALNFPRRIAAAGLKTGQHFSFQAFDPATLANAPMDVDVEAREVVWSMRRPVPAFRVKTRFSGVTSTSWITDVGEVVREESPTGLMVVRETKGAAMALAVPGDIQADMLRGAAIEPTGPRILEPTNVKRLRLRIDDAEVPQGDLDGGAQKRVGSSIEIQDPMTLLPTGADPLASNFLKAEPFIESDAPEIEAEALKGAAGAKDARLKAERLVRYVNALLEKRPTVSLPSALEVLRTKVGDCNEHTVLYVAMARSLGVPARIAVGLVFIHGAFYFHAWPEVYIAADKGLGTWLPVDPTLNQFPADATHLAVGRGGLEKQAAVVSLIGKARITIEDLETKTANTILVGRAKADVRPMEFDVPRRGDSIGCWSSPVR